MKTSTPQSARKVSISRLSSLLYFMFTVTLIAGCSMFIRFEEVKFDVIEKQEEVELRFYKPFLVAEVEVEGDFENAGSQAFRVLFKYIDGNNRSQSKIAMTAPVNQQSMQGSHSSLEGSGTKIASPTQVKQIASAADGKRYRVQFALPAKFTLETTPEPLDSRIQIRQVPAGHYAALVYSGRWSRENYENNMRILLKALEQNQWNVAGQPVWARYDDPFTPWFLRRNEILIPVTID